MKPHRSTNTHTSSVMKITKVYYALQTKTIIESPSRKLIFLLTLTEASNTENTNNFGMMLKRMTLSISPSQWTHFLLGWQSLNFFCKHIEMVHSQYSEHCITQV